MTTTILKLIGVTDAGLLGNLSPAYNVVQKMAETYQRLKTGQKRWKVVIQRAALIIRDLHEHPNRISAPGGIQKLQRKLEEVQNILEKFSNLSLLKAMLRHEDVEQAKSLLDECQVLLQTEAIAALEREVKNAKITLDSVPLELQPKQMSLDSIRTTTGRWAPEQNQWLITELDLEVFETIGGGGFSTVYKARYKGMMVAVKTLKDIGNMRKALEREIKIWSKLRHDHIVPFYGASTLASAPYIVSRYMQNGNLVQYLVANPNADRTKLVLEVSLGMYYLHEKSIVHGDLKGVNILVDDVGKACITDFGLSKVSSGNPGGKRGTVVGTLRYLAPEALKGHPLSFESDVYAFGMVIYEVFTGEGPFIRESDSWIWEGRVKLHRPTTSMAYERGFNDTLWQLLSKCISRNLFERPHFKTIQDQLRSITKAELSTQPFVPDPELWNENKTKWSLESPAQSFVSDPALWNKNETNWCLESPPQIFQTLPPLPPDQISFASRRTVPHGDILSASYFVTKLPFMDLSDATLTMWAQGDLTGVEGLLTEEIAHPLSTSHHAQALACRAIVRSRLEQWGTAIDDAKQSVGVQQSILGHVASAITHIGNGDYESAMRAFDLVFTDDSLTENKLLLLIKAIVLFWGEKHEDAVLRIDGLIDIVDDKSLYITVRAHMLLHLGGVSMREGNNERAVELLSRAKEAIPFQENLHLIVISLIFGWDFDGLDLAIQQHLEQCIKPLETHGDASLSKDPNDAILHYTAALSLHPSNPALLIKRSKAQAMLGLWDGALKDADEAIKADPGSPWGYERRRAALYGLQRYDEAIDAFSRMFPLIESSPDPDTRRLGKDYISPTRSENIIEDVIRGVFKTTPLVLIDVESGCLCDRPERTRIFKSEPQYQELIASMTEKLDQQRIHQVIETYFRYVTLSHVWQGKEPSFQDVNLAGSVWELDSSPLNDKLKRFCEVVGSDGYRWAWSDTCCIDKTISTVLNQSLMMMYKWYNSSAATFALLSSSPSPSSLGDLPESIWMTRAWTAQELLAAKVIRFYDRNWKPYLGDTQSNHKESPGIMQELADAIGIARETIINFNPDALSVRDKLRLASSREATVEEDVAYSLIGIFKSDIRPHYGEGDAALGHLLEEIVARSGEVTVLDWAGKSSSYNSCLPSTLAVYGQTPQASPAIDDANMDARIVALRDSLPQAEVTQIYNQVTHLPPARFGNRRLHLPCIIFSVTKLKVRDFGLGDETHYRARVAGIGNVDFQTSDRLSLMEPRRLALVHPWIRDLRDPLDKVHWGRTVDDDASESDSETGPASAPSARPHGRPVSRKIDDATRALRLIARLQQPFCALLLQQQPNREYRRVAAEHEIVVPGIEEVVHLARDVHADVVEIL